MIIITRQDEIKVAEETNFMYNKNVSNLSKFSMKMVEEFLRCRRSPKTTRRMLDVRRHHLFPLKSANGNVTVIMVEVVRITEILL